MNKESRRLRVGVLGCGNIAQIAHFDACHKARNVELFAVCDAAEDLRNRAAATHRPRRVYARYADLLSDSEVEAVVIGIADAFHVARSREALAAGKHVLVEKPLGLGVEECKQLVADAAGSGRVVQVGNNRRFDPGVAFAKRFIQEQVGDIFSLRAWYYDSAYRYTMTDNLQPVPVTSGQAVRPNVNIKQDKARYFLVTHGSHLVDMARFLSGDIEWVRARHRTLGDTHGWFVETSFANGALGHLDLTVPVCGDFEEGFRLNGEHGSVNARLHLPWFHKASEVECFSAKDRQYRRPLGEDAHTYKLQLEAFADTILKGVPQLGATAADGLAAVRALAAIAQAVRTGEAVRPAQVTGEL